MRRIAFALALALVLALAQCVPEEEERLSFLPGRVQVDHLTMLDNDRVEIERWNALNFGARVIDFRHADVDSRVKLDLPGGIKFEGENVAVGSDVDSGPVSLSAHTNDVQLVALSGSTTLSSDKSIDINVDGTEVNIDAFLDVIVRSEAVVKLGGGELDVRADGVDGVTIVGDKTVSIKAGAEGVGRNQIVGDKVAIAGDGGVQVTTDEDFEASAGRNLDISGDSVTMSTKFEIDIAAPLGNVFLDAGSIVQLFAAEGTFSGDSGVNIQSVTDSVTLSSTFDQPMVISAGDSVQVIANNRGVEISAVTGNVEVDTSGVINMSTKASTTASIADVVGASGELFAIVGDASTEISHTDDLKVEGGEDLLVQARTITSESGSFGMNGEHGQYYGRFLNRFASQDDLEVDATDSFIVHAHESATFESDGQVQFETVTGNIEFDGGRDVRMTATGGDYGVISQNNNIVLQGEYQSAVSALVNDVEFETGDTQITSGDDLLLRAGSILKFESSNDEVELHSLDDTNIWGGSLDADVVAAVTFTASENIHWSQVGGSSFLVDASTTADFIGETAHLGDTDTLLFDVSGSASFDSDVFQRYSFQGEHSSTAGDETHYLGSFVDFAAGHSFETETTAGVVSVEDWANLAVDARVHVLLSAAFDATYTTTTGDVTIEGLRGGRVAVARDWDITFSNQEWAAKNELSFSADDDVHVIESAETSTIKAHGEHVKLHATAGVLEFNADNAGALVSDRDLFVTAGGDFQFHGQNSLTMSAGEDLSYYAVDDVTAAATTHIEINSVGEGGKDITVRSGDDAVFSSGASTTIASKHAAWSAVESADFTGDNSFTIKATAGTFPRDDLEIHSSDTFTNVADKEYTFRGGSVYLDADELIDVIARGLFIDAAADVTIEADGGGSRWKTHRFPDENPKTYGDITMDAGVNLNVIAGRNYTFSSFDGYFKMTATGTGTVNGGIITVETAANENILFETEATNKAILLETGNLEDAFIFGDNNVEFTVTDATELKSTGRSKLNNNGITFRARSGGDVCYSTGNSNEALQIDGFLGVEITAPGDESDVVVDSFKGTSLEAENAIEIRSDGWSFDPRGVVGLDIPLGVLFRTTDASEGNGEGDIVIQADNAGVLMHGRRGASWISEEGTIEANADDRIDLRATDYLAYVSLFAKGDVGVNALGKLFVRAGSSSSDGDLRINGTKTGELNAVEGSISFEQLGGSADAAREAIRIHSEKGHVVIDANKDIEIKSSTDDKHNGAVTLIGETGEVTFNGNVIDVVSHRDTLTVQGESSATYTGSADTDISGKNVALSSGGQSPVKSTFNSFTLDAASAIEMDTVQGVKSTTTGTTTFDGDSFRAAAGGSLSLVSGDAQTTRVTSGSTLTIDADGELNVDAANALTSDFTTIQLSLGGSKVTTGLKLDANGPTTLTATKSLDVVGDFFEIKSAQIDITSANGDVELDAQGSLGGGMVIESLTSSVLATADLISFEVEDESFIGSGADQVLITSDEGALFEAPESRIHIESLSRSPITFESSLEDIEHTTLDYDLTAPEVLLTGRGGGSVLFLAEAFIEVEADTGMQFAAPVIEVQASPLNSDVTFKSSEQLWTGTTLDIDANEVDIDAENSISFVGNNLFASIADRAFVMSADTTFTATTTQNFEATALVDIVTSAESNLFYQATTELTLTSDNSIAAASDTLMGFTSTVGDLDLECESVDCLLRTNSVAATVFTSSTTFDVDGQSIEIAGSAVEQPQQTTFSATGAIDFTSPVVNVRSSERLSVKAEEEVDFTGTGDAQFESYGPGGLLVESATAMMATSTAQGMKYAATHELDVTAQGGEILVDTDATIQLTAEGEDGDVLFNSRAQDVTLTAGGLVRAVASPELDDNNEARGDGNGIIRVVSQGASDTTFVVPANVAFLATAGQDVTTRARDVIFDQDADNLFVRGRHEVVFESTSITLSSTQNFDAQALNEDGQVIVHSSGSASYTTTSNAGLTATNSLEVKSATGLTLKTTGGTSNLKVLASAGDLLLHAHEKDIEIDAPAATTFVATPEVHFGSGRRLDMEGAVINLDLDAGPATIFDAGQRITIEGLDTFNADNIWAVTPNDIEFRGFGGVEVLAGANAMVTADGPQADVLIWALEGASKVSSEQQTTIVGRHNLGPVGGMISTKEYNPAGVEMVVLDGTITVAGNTRLFARDGDVQVSAGDNVCFGSGTLGFFGSSTMRGSAIATTSGDYCAAGTMGLGHTCPQLSFFINSMNTAFLNYNLSA